jgi:DNA-binding PucR family transcriptional regulator
MASHRSPQESRADLVTRLRAVRPKIEQAALTRVYAVSEPSESVDPEYTQGLRAAVAAAVDYGLAAIEHGDLGGPEVPPALLVQARTAARSGVSLETVLRRYFAGYTLLGDFVIEETEQRRVGDRDELKDLSRSLAAPFDRLVAAITEEYNREARRPSSSPERIRFELVRRLLDGELLSSDELEYDLERHHVGAMTRGSAAVEAIRDLSRALDSRLLVAHPDDHTVWAWLGTREEVDRDRLDRSIASNWPADLPLAVGAPGEGITGWRLTHRQARAALPLARRDSRRIVFYAEVAPEASMIQDDLLVTSMQELYLDPLARGRPGGPALLETLRAYFAANRNGASAAAALGVSRQTINNRLRTVENRIGRRLLDCGGDLEMALRLEAAAVVPAVDR